MFRRFFNSLAKPHPEKEKDRAIDACRLEDRIMHSAVPGSEWLLDHLEVNLDGAASQNPAISLLDEHLNDPSENSSQPDQAEDPVDSLLQRLLAISDGTESQASELIIIDRGVDNFESLLADMTSNSAVSYDVVFIESTSNGIDQVTQALESYSGLDAIHFLTHGTDGSVALGNSRLDSGSLTTHAGQISSWANSMTSGGDILFYGCNLAATETGQEFLKALAALCDCDIAASDDLTGHKSLGGDWDLEYNVGVITTNVAFSSQVQAGWYGTLASFQEGVGGYTGTQDTYLNQNNAGAAFGNDIEIQIDMDDGVGDAATEGLIRFDGIIGTDPGDIPQGVQITSASLTLATNDPSAGTISIYEMQQSWSESSVWNDFNGLTPGVELAALPLDSVTGPSGTVTFTGLESSIQNWIDGAPNYGWGIIASTTDQWHFDSSESANQPILSVSYITPGSNASTAHTITVDTANDVWDGDTTSIDALLADKGADGLISLREAIWAANNTTNIDASTPDVINFAIGVVGSQQTITLADALPALTDPVYLDALSQGGTGYSGDPLIRLDVSATANSATAGILVLTSDSTVRGFAVTGSPDEGIEISGNSGHGAANNNTIENNWVGIDFNGNAASNADNGILILENASNNIVRNNVVASNSGNGIELRGPLVTGNVVQGNLIGVADDGFTVRANAENGIHLSDTASGNTIGGTATGEANIIANSGGDGIAVNSDAGAGNSIRGNSIYNSTGMGINLAQTYESFTSSDSEDELRTTQSWGQTFLHTSGNGSYAVDRISIQLRNSGGATQNITVSLKSSWNGATLATASISSSSISDEMNWYDFDFSDVTLADTTAYTIRIESDNALGGVYVASSTSNGYPGGTKLNTIGVPQNSNDIPFQVSLMSGVTANELGDGDSGANNLQNFPVLSSATYNGGTTDVAFSLNSNTSQSYAVDFFATAGDDEAAIFLGSETISTDGTGNYSGTANLVAKVPAGYQITATATDLSTGDTSELSAGVSVTGRAGLIVNTNSDNADGTTTSIAALLANPGADGLISLREAILATNLTANGATPDEIHFLLPHQGPYTIDVASALPTISQSVIIDGSLQQTLRGDGNVAVTEQTTGPEIVINASATTEVPGLNISGDNVTIRNIGVTGTNGSTVNGSGMYISGQNAFIDTVTVTDSGAVGIYGYGSSGTTITNSVLRNNGLDTIQGDGISLRGPITSFTITNNEIIDNIAFGIDFSFGSISGVNISNNLIKNNGYSGSILSAGIGVRSGSNSTIQNNQITGNAGDGITVVSSSTGINITQNTIWDNGNLGIDLSATVNTEGDGVTLNDVGDSDSGGNNLQNFPVITSASTNDSSLVTVDGTVNFAASTIYRLEFYSSATQDVSGHGEAESYLGAANVTTDGTGFASFSESFAANLAVGEYITMTARDPSNNTSEFSAGFAATLDNTPPTFTAFTGVVDTTNENVEAEITFAEIAVQGNESDANGFVDAFIVKSVNSGNLNIGTSAGTATAWAAGVNDVIDATLNAYWTPFSNENGTRDAFEVVARDNHGAESTGPVIAQVLVNPVNNAPQLVGTTLVTNGDFATGDLSGWSATGNVDNDGVQARFGQIGGPNGVLSQTMTTEVGKTYVFSFDYHDASVTKAQSLDISVTGATTLVDAWIDSGIAANTAQTYQYAFVADSTSTTITFTDTSADHSGVRGYLDNVFVKTDATPSSALSYTENQGPLVIDASLTVEDIDDANIESAVVQITGNYANGQDFLAFVNQNGIIGTWNATQGSMTLTGSATKAQYQTAIRSVTFENTSDNPSVLTRTISFTVNDGDVDSNIATRDLNISAVNDTPVISGPGTFYTVDEQTNLAIEGTGFSVADSDAGTGTMTATVAVGEGSINVVTGNSGVTISSGNGSGTVTLTGTRTEIDNLLTGAGTGTITYNNGSDTPLASTTITVTVNDGGNTGSDPGLTGDGFSEEGSAVETIYVTATNDDPYNSGLLATDIAILEDVTTNLDLSSVNIVDVDASSGSLTVTLSVGSGTIDATAAAGITIGGSGTNIVTLGGTLSDLNNYLNLATNLQYTGATNLNGDNADVLVFTVNDNGNTGTGGGTPVNFGSVNIDLTAVNDDPVNTGGSPPASVTLTEDVAANLDLSVMVIDDVDVLAGNLTLLLTTTSGATLSSPGGTGITVGGNGTTAFSVSGSLADLNSFIANPGSIQLQGASNANGLSADQVTVSITDNGNTGQGGGGSIGLGLINVDITPVNDPAVVSNLESSAVSYTENSGAVALTSLISLSDVDDTNLEMATIQITGNYSSGNDLLAFVDTPSITGSFDAFSGTLTLLGTDTLANYQAAIRSVTFENTSNNPSTATRTVTWVVNDGDDDSVPVTRDIAITATNDPSVLNGIEATPVSYTENSGAVSISSSIAISDVDDTLIESAQIAISANYSIGEDILDFVDTLNITSSFDALNGILTLTGSDTLAAYQTALRNVTYENLSNDPDTTARTISFSVNDGDADSNAELRSINITATNDAPSAATIESTDLAYTENDAPTAITSTLTITDEDDLTLESAVVQITGNYVNGEDLLAFTNTVSIIGSYDALTGTLTLTGSDTVANYQAALRSVTYENLSENPSTLARTVSFTVNDGDVDSNVASRNITVAAVNDAPVAYADGPLVADESTNFTLTPTSNDSDFENDFLTITAINGNAIVAGGPALLVTGGTINLAADGFTLTFTPSPNAFGDADFTYTITDGNGLYDTATVDFDIVDTQAPGMPIVSLLEDANNDGFINIAEQIGLVDLQVTLPAGALEGETLNINGINQVLNATDIANGFVNSSLPAPAHNDTVTVSVYLFDPAGNSSAIHTDVAYVDLVASATSGALDLMAASDSGVSNIDNYTGDLSPTFKLPAGSGNPGDMIRIFADGVEVGVDYVQPDGGVLITVVVSGFDIKSFTYTFTDPALNESGQSIGLDVDFFDNTLPFAPPAGPAPEPLGTDDEDSDLLEALLAEFLNESNDDDETTLILPNVTRKNAFVFTESATARRESAFDISSNPVTDEDKRSNWKMAIASLPGQPLNISFSTTEMTLTDEQSYAFYLQGLAEQYGKVGDELREEFVNFEHLTGVAQVGACVALAGYAVWMTRVAWLACWVFSSIPMLAGFDPLALLNYAPGNEETLEQIAKGGGGK